MSQSRSEQLVDVRPLPQRTRQSTIFNAWQELASGEAILLVNDHDPLPLYFQFACEHAGRFRWDYLQEGPETWRVRILKGEHLDPGFIPARKPRPVSRVGEHTPVDPLVLDTCPIFHRGESPCGAIDDAIADLVPGQPLVLLVPFEPMPLYLKLGAQGYAHTAEQQEDGRWRVEFKKAAE